jgi:uncharacterized protein YkuJ
MKKTIVALALCVFTLSAFAAGPGIDEKVVRAFEQTFPNVQEVNWVEQPQSYEVSFKQNETRATITYDKEGNILKTLRYYGEAQLPIMVISRLRTKFGNKKIFGVVEECSEEGMYYHITLEDDTHWTKVRADTYGSISIEQKFKKA